MGGKLLCSISHGREDVRREQRGERGEGGEEMACGVKVTHPLTGVLCKAAEQIQDGSKSGHNHHTAINRHSRKRQIDIRKHDFQALKYSLSLSPLG